MISGSIARRYARAVMGIGVDQKNFEKLGTEIGALATAMRESTELAETLSNPAFPKSDRLKVLKAILKRLAASKTTTNFTLLLLDNDRLAALPGISRELNAMIDERAGRVAAVVTSATPITPMQLQQLKTSLEKLSGKKVQIEKKQDPELLGGLVAKVGDIVYDGSLRGQLDRLKDQIG